MSIWHYKDSSRDVTLEAVRCGYCIYCRSPLDRLPERIQSPDQGYTETTLVCLCPACGWWTITNEIFDNWIEAETTTATKGAAGSLLELDLNDISQPLDEIRRYLLAKYDARCLISPYTFEDTVASVFRDIGYETVVTARAGDDGIDVILNGPNHERIGVQVKRWKNAIKAEQIRALAGALILGRYTKGVFVTTSHFQPGAENTTRRLKMLGVPIELLDAPKFFDVLKIAQQTVYRPSSVEEIYRQYRPHLRVLVSKTEKWAY